MELKELWIPATTPECTIKPNGLLVYAHFVSKRHFAQPTTITQTCFATGVSEKTVRSWIDWLTKSRLIENGQAAHAHADWFRWQHNAEKPWYDRFAHWTYHSPAVGSPLSPSDCYLFSYL